MVSHLQIAKIILEKIFQRTDSFIFRAFSYLPDQLGICPKGSSHGEPVNVYMIV